MTANRHIIVGDIHACADSLFALLRECSRKPGEAVVSVGDLVDRGPDPTSVVCFLMEDDNPYAVSGNHEDTHVRVNSGELRPASTQLATQLLMGDFYADASVWFAQLPTWRMAAGHFICHAGVDWQHPLDAQPRGALLRGKVTSRLAVERGVREKHDPMSQDPTWIDDYQGETTVVYGHYSGDSVRERTNSLGIDTGAGGGKDLVNPPRLTALILPEREFVSVPAPDSVVPEMLARRRAEFVALESAHVVARARLRPTKVKAVPKQAPTPLRLDGVELNGLWLMEQHGYTPGAALGRALAALKEAHQAGELKTLSDVDAVLALLAP